MSHHQLLANHRLSAWIQGWFGPVLQQTNIPRDLQIQVYNCDEILRQGFRCGPIVIYCGVLLSNY